MIPERQSPWPPRMIRKNTSKKHRLPMRTHAAQKVRDDGAHNVAQALPSEPRRWRCANARPVRSAAVRVCRRRDRLQPRRLGPRRDAGGDDQLADSANNYLTALFNRPEATTTCATSSRMAPSTRATPMSRSFHSSRMSMSAWATTTPSGLDKRVSPVRNPALFSLVKAYT